MTVWMDYITALIILVSTLFFFYQTTEWDDQTECPSLGLVDFLPMKQPRERWRRAAGSGLESGNVNVNVKAETKQSDS